MVPVGFSHVDSTVIAPSATRQLPSPDQPVSVLPSNSDVHPSCSLKSIGSGCLKPPPPPCRPPCAACGGCAPGRASGEDENVSAAPSVTTMVVVIRIFDLAV